MLAPPVHAGGFLYADNESSELNGFQENDTKFPDNCLILRKISAAK